MDFLLVTDFTQLQFSVGTVNKYLEKLSVRPSKAEKINHNWGLVLDGE
jgi:hypothetical protein